MYRRNHRLFLPGDQVAGLGVQFTPDPAGRAKKWHALVTMLVPRQQICYQNSLFIVAVAGYYESEEDRRFGDTRGQFDVGG